MNIKSVLESLMFAWGEPLNINEISKILNLPSHTITSVLNEMIDEYKQNEDKGLIIQKYGTSYQLTTKRENFEYIQSLLQSTVNKSLSTAAMETLSIIAYKQPVTKVEIEQIRGVKCSQVVKGLLDKNLIKEVGRLDKPGRPTIYSTTDEFLRHFGLSSIDELPCMSGEINLEEENEIRWQGTELLSPFFLIMGILLIIVGGLVFIYLNVKCRVKINFSYSFLYVNIYLIIIKKKYVYEKIFNYLATEKILKHKESKVRHFYQNRRKYIKYFKKVFNFFYIKNILLYPEFVSEKQSFAVEFVVVNRMLKKSILNG